MKGSLWAVLSTLLLGALLFSGADLAAQGNGASAPTVVEPVTQISGEIIGLALFVMLIFFGVAYAFAGGDW